MDCIKLLNTELVKLRNEFDEIFYDAYIQAEGLCDEALQILLHEYTNNMSYEYVCEVTKRVFENHKDETSEISERIEELKRDAPIEITKKIRPYFQNKKQRETCFKRMKKFLDSTYTSFEEYAIAATNDLKDYVNEFCVILNENENIETEDDIYDVLIEKNRFDFKQIYTSREMIKYAESLGYEYKRCKGSHARYEHKITHKSVSIVTHEIGKGLSYRVQKDLLNRCK